MSVTGVDHDAVEAIYEAITIYDPESVSPEYDTPDPVSVLTDPVCISIPPVAVVCHDDARVLHESVVVPLEVIHDPVVVPEDAVIPEDVATVPVAVDPVFILGSVRVQVFTIHVPMVVHVFTIHEEVTMRAPLDVAPVLSDHEAERLPDSVVPVDESRASGTNRSAPLSYSTSYPSMT